MSGRPRKILVSGCLDGAPIRHDGSGVALAHPIWRQWKEEGRLVTCCPEMAGGFATPRPPAEIIGGTAAEVIQGTARIRDIEGRDVTDGFLQGARRVLELARGAGVALAVMTDGSPSCGSTRVHAGRFDGTTIPGSGVAVELLVGAGIPVFSHTDLDSAAAHLRGVEQAHDTY